MKRSQDSQWRRMFAISGKFPLTDAEHRQFIGMVVGREVTSRKTLTPLEVRQAVAAYEGYLLMSQLMRDARDSGRRLAEPTPGPVGAVR